MTCHPPCFWTLSEGLFSKLPSPVHWQLHIGVTDTFGTDRETGSDTLGRAKTVCGRLSAQAGQDQSGKKQILSDFMVVHASTDYLAHAPSDNACGSNALWWGGLRWTLSKIMILLPKKGSPEKGRTHHPRLEKNGGGFYGVQKVGIVLLWPLERPLHLWHKTNAGRWGLVDPILLFRFVFL